MIIHEKLFNAVILNVAFSGTETWEPLFQFLSSSVFLRMCWRRVLVTHLVFHCYDNKFPHLMAYQKLCSDNSWDDLLAGLPSVGSGEGPLYLEKSLASPPSLCAAPLSHCCCCCCGCHHLLPHSLLLSSCLSLLFVCVESSLYVAQGWFLSWDSLSSSGVCWDHRCGPRVLSSIAFWTGGWFLSSLSALVGTFRGHLDSSFSRPYVTSAAVPFATAVGVTGCRPWSVDSLRKCYLSTTVGGHYHLKVWLLRNDR